LVEFSYKSDYQSTIKMDAFMVLYGRKQGTLSYWSELDEALIIGLN